MSFNIAVVGLGRVGSAFFEELTHYMARGLKVVCVAELGDTPGKILAAEKGIDIVSLEQLVHKGAAIDVIFDLTGDPGVRKFLRELLHMAENNHTVVVPETVTRMIWSLVTDKPLPNVHTHQGY